MLKKFLATYMLLSCAMFGYSQVPDSAKKSVADSTKTSPPVTITGSVDVYYRYNFNAPSGKTNNLTSFTNSQNSFELGMASLRVDHTMGKVAATLDVGFGRRAQEFSYNDGGTSMQLIKQAYLSYAPS